MLLFLGAWVISAFAVETPLAPPPSPSTKDANYHLIGWFNTFVPGGGQFALGNYWLSGTQATIELGTFLGGHALNNNDHYSLDGAQAKLPAFQRRKRLEEADVDGPLIGGILQEFGIKYHMVNVFNAYRTAAAERDDRIDPSETSTLFLAPFKMENLGNPWVYIPISVVSLATIADYMISKDNIARTGRVKASSNFLYAFNFMAWQPAGSGAPEEMFYRGFVQNEAYHLTHSSLLSIAASTLAFSLSHERGPGRISAAVAGAYLGFLADKYHGRLAPGITLHFWSAVLLGVQSVLVNHEGQRTTPPGGFYVQIDY